MFIHNEQLIYKDDVTIRLTSYVSDEDEVTNGSVLIEFYDASIDPLDFDSLTVERIAGHYVDLDVLYTFMTETRAQCIKFTKHTADSIFDL